MSGAGGVLIKFYYFKVHNLFFPRRALVEKSGAVRRQMFSILISVCIPYCD